MTARLQIRQAVGADADQVVTLLSGALTDVPIAQWLFPTDNERHMVLPEMLRGLVDHALLHGEVHTTSEYDAVAIWFPYTISPPPQIQFARLGRTRGDESARASLLDDALEHENPLGRTHHRLAVLAVHPDRQRQGLGNAMLRHHHNYLDRLEIAAYLKASNSASRDFFLRHGYRPYRPPVRLPDGHSVWPLWRQARLA